MVWSRRWSIAVVVVILSFSDGGSGKGTCPENVLSSATECFPSDFSSGLISNMTAIQQHCQSGVFEKAYTCLTQVEASCRGDKDTLLLLHSFMDVKRWKASLDELCSKVHILRVSATCWAVTSQKSAQCIQKEMLELQNRLMNSPDPGKGKGKGKTRARSSSKSSSSSRSSSASSSSTYTLSASSVSGESVTVEETLENLKHYCNTSRGILDCFKPSLHDLCSKEAALLLEGIYLASQPPLCDPKVTSPDDDTNPDQGGRASGKPLSAILFMSCVTLSAAAVLRAGFSRL